MKRLLRFVRFVLLRGIAATGLGCALFAPGGRYGPRDKNCNVTKLEGAPRAPFDDLGTVTVDCWTENAACEQELLDEVCRRGGDVVWGVGDTAPNTTKLAGHVARTRGLTGEDGGSS